MKKNNISIYDVSACLLDKMGPISLSQLHALLYYCQAWNLAIRKKPLFEEELKINYCNMPIIETIKNNYGTSDFFIKGNKNKLKDNKIINFVLFYYSNDFKELDGGGWILRHLLFEELEKMHLSQFSKEYITIPHKKLEEYYFKEYKEYIEKQNASLSAKKFIKRRKFNKKNKRCKKFNKILNKKNW